MSIRTEEIEQLLLKENDDDPLIIVPKPVLKSGAASIDLRLGTWFMTPRQSRLECMDTETATSDAVESKIMRSHYVPFGESFILHPQNFALAATLEWVRIPRKFSGYLMGRSSWGRRGLVIATAVGVHPGFSGCLTLELANLGNIAIRVEPGLTICQLFLERAEGDKQDVDGSYYVGRRRPVLGPLGVDTIAMKLREFGMRTSGTRKNGA